VPLELTGDPQQPVAVRANANGTYRVGVSPLWRIGKKMLGIYLPFRFKAESRSSPAHPGAGWSWASGACPPHSLGDRKRRCHVPLDGRHRLVLDELHHDLLDRAARRGRYLAVRLANGNRRSEPWSR
jgi:hypothetical protein